MAPTDEVMDLGRAELVRFLGLRAPFDTLSREELGDLAADAELEFHPRGAAILTEDGGPVTFLRVIHAGAVSIVHDGRLLDTLGTGDSFGDNAMLAGMAPGFEARAAEDTLCYRIPATSAAPLLARARQGVAAVHAGDPASRPVAELTRTPLVLGRPDESIRALAARMTAAQAGAAVIELPASAAGLGMVTDADLRTRALAAGLGPDAPVATVMTCPVCTVSADRLGAQVLFDLLERGIDHAPVLNPAGRALGVITEADLTAPRQRSWFGARRQIAAAMNADQLAHAGRLIAPILTELHSARLGALEIARVLCALTDAQVLRATELARAEVPCSGAAWIALSGHARRELTPASRPAGAVVWTEQPDSGWPVATTRILERSGLPAPITSIRARHLPMADLDAAAIVALLTDRRPLTDSDTGRVIAATLPAPQGELRAALLTRLTACTPHGGHLPTGFDQDGVLGGDGARREHINIHVAAVAPIQTIARWAGVVAGETGGSTPERLAAAADAGHLTDSDARALTDAFTAAFELRMAHQMEQLAACQTPDDIVATDALSPFARGQLREVFRTVSAVSNNLPTRPAR